MTSRSLTRSWAMPPHATPPTFPGMTSEPCSDGGVKRPSERSAADRAAAPRAILVGRSPGIAGRKRRSCQRRRRGWKRLRRRRHLTGDIAPGHGPLLDRNQRLAGLAIEDEQMAGLGSDGDRRDGAAVLAPVEEDRRRGDVVVPEIVVNGLKVPDPCAGISAKRHDRVGEQVVARGARRRSSRGSGCSSEQRRGCATRRRR